MTTSQGRPYPRIIAVLMLVLPGLLQAQDRQPDLADLIYGTVGARALMLDLYLPEGIENPPLIVWVHGGAWREGSKDGPPTEFVEEGYAMASLDFRLSGEAPFPAQIHDIKAAIRFLRAEAPSLGYRADRIAIMGASSGGHLVELVGVTNGVASLEGEIGDHPGESSDVQAVVSYYGASNLTTILSQSTPHGLSVREPALRLFIGGLPDEVPETAEMASPVFHVDASDPPLLLLHGDQDPQMPINQSHELEGRYERLGLDVSFDVVHDAAHGGQAFFEDPHLARALEFLDRTIGANAPGQAF